MQEYEPKDKKDSPAYEVLRDQLLDKTNTVKGIEFYEVKTGLGEKVVVLSFSVPTKTLKMGRQEVVQLTRLLSEAARKLPR